MAGTKKTVPIAVAVAVAAAAAAPVPVPVPVPSDPVPSDPAASVDPSASAEVPPPIDKIAVVIASLLGVQSKLKDLANEVRDTINNARGVQKVHTILQKDNTKLASAAIKRGRRPIAADTTTTVGSDNASSLNDMTAPRRPSGFAKPSLLSEEMCEFLNKPPGSLIARTDVTRAITQYVKDNQLFDQMDKRTICPDAKLSKLLALPEGGDAVKITYFNLQSFIKHHFRKGEETTDVDAASASASASDAAAVVVV